MCVNAWVNKVCSHPFHMLSLESIRCFFINQLLIKYIYHERYTDPFAIRRYEYMGYHVLYRALLRKWILYQIPLSNIIFKNIYQDLFLFKLFIRVVWVSSCQIALGSFWYSNANLWSIDLVLLKNFLYGAWVLKVIKIS